MVSRKLKDDLANKIDDQNSRKLTEKQRKFAELYVEGRRTNTDCAIEAGYSESSAKFHACHMLDGRRYPHVVDYIAELRAEQQRIYGVTTLGQLRRFDQLSRGAEEAGQYAAAVSAEKVRSALGGLTIDRRENINTFDQLSREEIVSRLAALQQQYPAVFDASLKDVTPSRSSESDDDEVINMINGPSEDD